MFISRNMCDSPEHFGVEHKLGEHADHTFTSGSFLAEAF